MMHCDCLTPAIIVNKHVPYFLMSRPHCTMPGIDLAPLYKFLHAKKHINDFEKIYNFIYDWLIKATREIRHSSFIINEKRQKIRVRSPFLDCICNGDEYLILDEDTGELEDLFTLCECGHCELCTNAKRNTWSLRCQLECQSHHDLPYFVTLTYNNDTIPKDGELSPKDLNKFVHRFRKNLLYHYKYDKPFRILKCGEYGSLHGRPHYHLLIWFDYPVFPYPKKHVITKESHDAIECSRISYLINQSWSYRVYDHDSKKWNHISLGFTFVEKCTNDQCGEYLGKYLSKFNTDRNEFVSDKKIKPFVIGSRKNGCIGKPFVESLRNQFLKLSPGQDMVYTDRHSVKSELKVLPLNKWVLNVLVPSVSRQLDKSIRDVYHQLQQNLAVIQRTDFFLSEEIQTLLNDIFVFPLFDNQSVFCFSVPSELQPHKLNEVISEIFRGAYDLQNANINFQYINEIALCREKFLCYHLSTYQSIPIWDKVDNMRRYLSLENHRHKLKNDCQ